MILLGWGFIGLIFWVSMLWYNGLPTQWKSVGRVDGWDEQLVVWLPLSIMGGPLWWLALIAVRNSR